MSEGIFGKVAPHFWERGFPIVPVEGKAPVVSGWTGLLGGTPSEAKRGEWLQTYRDNNIGLLLGHEVVSGWLLIAFDVDDDRLLKLVLHVLGLSRAERRATLAGKRGKKGATIFVRAPRSLRSTVIKGGGDLGNTDVLAAGKLTVVPPSIHPETGEPYTVYGESLLNVVFADLPEATEHQVELLKATSGYEHAAVLISGKATHDAGVALTAVLVSAGATDEEIVTIFTGLLPDDYDGNSLEELPEWIHSAREKDFGRPDEKDSLTKQLVMLALSADIELFNDGDSKAFATLPHLGRAVAVRLSSTTFKLWLRHLVHTA